jgi:hypothetical protein
VRDGVHFVSAIDIHAIKNATDHEFEEFLSHSPSLESMKRLPIKNTGIPARVAQTLGLSLKKYKETVLHQLEINSPEGQRMRNGILREMPVLP